MARESEARPQRGEGNMDKRTWEWGKASWTHVTWQTNLESEHCIFLCCCFVWIIWYHVPNSTWIQLTSTRHHTSVPHCSCCTAATCKSQRIQTLSHTATRFACSHTTMFGQPAYLYGVVGISTLVPVSSTRTREYPIELLLLWILLLAEN